MDCDFTSIIDRRGKDALAVDGVGCGGSAPEAPREGFDVIPMWVADMNFPTCPAIQKAIIERVQHPCFGYFTPSDQYYDGIIRWQSHRNGVNSLTRDDIGYENGVLGCVASAAQAFTAPGEAILVHSPTYIGFTNALKSCGRTIVHSPLVQNGQGVWRMDYEDMRQKLQNNHIHLAIFCSPHNPTGRVWTQEEIKEAMEIYREHDVVVISDEIWSDIILENNRHTPTQSVSEDARSRTIAVYAPSKTFSLAGLVGSYHIIYSSYLRDRLEQQEATSHYNAMNVLSMHALVGAYTDEGEQWTDELCATLSDNLRLAYEFMTTHFPDVQVSMPQGTYMLLLNCQQWCENHHKTLDQLLKAGWDVGVGWQDGRPFHVPYGIRVNFALPRSRVEEALDRMNRYVFLP